MLSVGCVALELNQLSWRGFRAGGADTSLVQREAATAGDSPGATTLPLPLSQTKSWSFPDSVLM